MKTDFDFLSLCRLRRSVRRFSPEPLRPGELAWILECARLAPSACNLQPWQVVVVDDRDTIRDLSSCAAFGLSKTAAPGSIAFIADAPVVLALCLKRGLAHKVSSLVDMDFSCLDLGIFGEHVVLAAASLGIGSCWIGMASERRVRPVLGLPRSVRLLALIALGRPPSGSLASLESPPRRRMDAAEFCWHNRYGVPWNPTPAER